MTELGDRPEAAAASRHPWPVVFYFHHVSDTIEHYTNMSPRHFREAMALIAAHYEVLEPRQAPWGRGRLLRRTWPTALLTIDDCSHHFFDNGRPILDEFGLRATFFAIPDRAANPSAFHEDTRSRHMSWDDLGCLIDDGHVVGNHTIGHLPLNTCSADEVADRIGRGDELILAELGLSDLPVAYPFGRVPQNPDALAVLDGRLAFSTVRVPATPWDLQPRRIRRTFLPYNNPDSWYALLKRWATPWLLSIS